MRIITTDLALFVTRYEIHVEYENLLIDNISVKMNDSISLARAHLKDTLFSICLGADDFPTFLFQHDR